MGILWTIVIGFVAGIIAKFLHPGPNEPSGFILTTILGIVGAFLATFLGQALGWYRPDQGAGLIGAVSEQSSCSSSGASLLAETPPPSDSASNSDSKFNGQSDVGGSMSRGLRSMTALLGLLAIAGYQNRDKLTEMLGGKQGVPGAPQVQSGLGGLLGQLTGGLGAGCVGGLLSGGLGELVDRFKQSGHGETVDSWVSSGPSKQVASSQLEQRSAQMS
jgi:uncharacterized protein YidB (DUF937 family)/uncharacterized membrane protein YeaQ/YmgE (transglycosylase-associated protein family)